MTTTPYPELDRVPRHSPRCEADQGDAHCPACVFLADYSAWRNDDTEPEGAAIHPFSVTCTCAHCEAVWARG